MWFINPIFTCVHSLRSMSSKVACIDIYIRINGTMNAMFEHVKSLRLIDGLLCYILILVRINRRTWLCYCISDYTWLNCLVISYEYRHILSLLPLWFEIWNYISMWLFMQFTLLNVVIYWVLVIVWTLIVKENIAAMWFIALDSCKVTLCV